MTIERATTWHEILMEDAGLEPLAKVQCPVVLNPYPRQREIMDGLCPLVGCTIAGRHEHEIGGPVVQA